MKTKPTLFSVIVFVIMVLTSFNAFGGDGNWWRSLNDLHCQGVPEVPKVLKVFYIDGFRRGMDAGSLYSLGPIDKRELKKLQGKELEYGEAALRNYFSNYNRYFLNTSIIQIVDGLDVFYEDFKNRKIFVSEAINFVVLQIAGVPSDEMEKMIEEARRNVK